MLGNLNIGPIGFIFAIIVLLIAWKLAIED